MTSRRPDDKPGTGRFLSLVPIPHDVLTALDSEDWPRLLAYLRESAVREAAHHSIVLTGLVSASIEPGDFYRDEDMYQCVWTARMSSRWTRRHTTPPGGVRQQRIRRRTRRRQLTRQNRSTN